MSATERSEAHANGPEEKVPVRSMDIVVKNVTDLTWSLKSAELKHGIWHKMGSVDWSPPSIIHPYSRGHFNAESSGVATGTEGTVIYQSSSGDMAIYFDDPCVGSNEFSCSPPPGFDESHGDISGNSATITTTVTPSV